MTDKITNQRQLFGSYLQRLLRERRIGQQPLASYLGTTVGAISKYTTGRNLPDDSKMEAISDFLRGFLSESELIELTKLYLNASTSIKLVDSSEHTVIEKHFLTLFNQLKPEQQQRQLGNMLQDIEDNNNEMAQNAGLEINEPQAPYGVSPRASVDKKKQN